MKKFITMFMIVIMLVLNGPMIAFAAWSEQENLTASTTDNNLYGEDVDMNDTGEYAVVGASFEDGTNIREGAAWVYKRTGTTWSTLTGNGDCDGVGGDECLKSDSPALDERFGEGVSIDGDYLAVGAPTVTGTGHVYIYKNNGSDTYTYQHTITGPTSDSTFGKNVDLDGDYVMISNGGYTSYQGAVYIYERDTGLETWSQLALMYASDGSSNDSFGANFDLEGDYAIIGAADKNSYAGSAYIFYKGEGGGADWDNGSTDEQAVIVGSDTQADDTFGFSVSIDGNYAVVGAPGAPGGLYQGSAYVFYKDGASWDAGSADQQQELTASDAANDDEFGGSVSIDGTTLISTAYTGTYFWDRSGTTWSESQKIDAPVDTSTYGVDADMVGNYALVGNWLSGSFPMDGEAFVYYYTSTGGGVPEFSDYMYMLTILIAIGLMVKIVPQVNIPARPV